MLTRKLIVSGIMSAKDDETSGGDEHGSTVVNGLAVVSPGIPSDLVKMALRVGGEVRVELELYASIADNNFVRIQGISKLFEGTSEDTNDLEDQESIDLKIPPDNPTEHKIHLVNSGIGGGDTADIILLFTNVEGAPRRTMPPTVDIANRELLKRQEKLLRAWALNFRYKSNGTLPPWDPTDGIHEDRKKSLRQIAAGMAIFADPTKTFKSLDWALLSGLPTDKPKSEHLQKFRDTVQEYLENQAQVCYQQLNLTICKQIGTECPGKDVADYDFLLRDIVALIHIFIDKPEILTNEMIRKLIGQDQISFSQSGSSYVATGRVPFSGQNLDEWLAEGPSGRHYFQEYLLPAPIPIILPPPAPPISFLINPKYKLSTPETENHLLGIYAWRFLVNEYLTYVASLSPENDPFKRFDPYLKALVDSDPDRYKNNPATLDWVLQLLGRIPHSGLFEANAKPYESVSILGIMAFYQAADRLFPNDPMRQKIKTAAQNALDYLAAEYAFQSFEGKRISPSRRNQHESENVGFYASDYLANMFGILTGAYVYSDDNGAANTTSCVCDGGKYDLHLMSVLTIDGLMNEGRNLFIAALVNTNLHIRIFDTNGQKVVDKGESELVAGEKLITLKALLNNNPGTSGLSCEAKQKIIEDAAFIADYGYTKGGATDEPCWATPYHWSAIDQNGGFALWSMLSGYRVPACIHDFMLNKHGGYFARIQTRYSRSSYPLEVTFSPIVFSPVGEPPTPSFSRPRYFQEVSSGHVSAENYDVAGSQGFEPITQSYFATPDYLNSVGGHPSSYYLGHLNLPVLPDVIADTVAKGIEQVRNYDQITRPSTLITRGNLQIRDKNDIAALERSLPTMRGDDRFQFSRNLSTYKNFSLGYIFYDDRDRHLDWPQRYPDSWKDFLVERFGIGRAAFHVFDFTAQPEHPLAGYYWVLAQFSKSENKSDFRNYGRGFWEVVPGHQFPNTGALVANIQANNPGSHFDNDEKNHYTYRLASTGERVVIDNRFGSPAASQAILEIWTRDESPIPLNTYTADLRDESALRQLPLLDVWQVDRDYNFTGMKYAYADGHGRVTIHNPFLGETLILDSSDYRSPTCSLDNVGFAKTQLPAIEGTQGQVPSMGAILLDKDFIYATHYFVPELFKPSLQTGELVALDRLTLAPVKRVTVGKEPHSIALHQATNHLYVVNYQDASLSVIDAAQFTVVDTMQIPGFSMISTAVSQKYHRIFATQPGQKRMIVINAQTRTQLPSMTNLALTGEVVVDEATDRLYTLVKNAANETLQDVIEFEINAQGQQELRRTTLDGQVSRPSAMAVDAKQLYIINKDPQISSSENHQKLTVLDRRTLGVISSVPLNTRGGLGIATSVSQNVIYVTTQYDIQIIDTRSLKSIRKIELKDYQMAAYQPKGVVTIDEQTGVAYFGGAGSSTLIRHGLPRIALGP
jgi:DNA-binding beta-propeller fold protein YncE